MAYQGEARRPDYCGIYIADVLTGTYALGAIVAALYQRQATGEGQMIDVSMLDSMLSLTLSEIQAAQFAVTPPGRPVFGPIATKDGWINLSIASERTFQSLAAASGHPHWLTEYGGTQLIVLEGVACQQNYIRLHRSGGHEHPT
jgi:crotonobetainyl-CoA:carnitine CoA-transferase CaiB-like acyl-CoA transferase